MQCLLGNKTVAECTKMHHFHHHLFANTGSTTQSNSKRLEAKVKKKFWAGHRPLNKLRDFYFMPNARPTYCDCSVSTYDSRTSHVPASN